jgi:hypothetical protein
MGHDKGDIMSTKRTTLVDRIMNEVALYGGLPMRRCDIYTLATEHLGEHAGAPFGADWFAFHPVTVNVEPLSLGMARRICNGTLKGAARDSAIARVMAP